MRKKIERVVSKQKDRWRETLGARFNIHHPYLAATPTLASTLRADTRAHLSRKARDLELAEIGAQPRAPRITAGPAASPGHSTAPGPPFHLRGTSGNSFLLDYQAGLANQEQAGSCQGKEKRHQGSVNSGQLARNRLLTLPHWKPGKEKLFATLTQMCY